MARRKKNITAEELRQRLYYDTDTGLFRWIQGGRWNELAGKVAGNKTATANGYIYINLSGKGGKLYLAHRLAWLYMTGEWPTAEIDHINGARADNRWANLREATRQQQNGNLKLDKRSTTGIRGVHRVAKTGKYIAHISPSGRYKYLGIFETLEEAAQARKEAADALFGRFARHR